MGRELYKLNGSSETKKDERGIMIKNKARLVTQGYTQEEGINYDEVFAPVSRIEAIRLFLAYASYKDFVVYQMDVKSAFLYGKIKEEVYVCQPLGFEDPDFPDRVYKVEKALYGLHQAPRACFSDVKTASTPTETHMPLLKDADGEDIDEHIFQVNPKVSHLHVVKRIFRYLKALVDGKKIVVTEASVRRDLQLEDAEGVDCLPNAIIFEQLTLMGTMAFAIICLATNQKFNFSKYIFESMVKNLDSAGKFLMYPRFVQVFLDNQLEGMINHNRINIAPSHTKKGFANMKRQGKDFFGSVTPLFSTMMVQAQQEQGEGSYMPTIISPSTSQPQRKQRPRKPKRKDTEIPQSSVPVENVADEAVYEERDDSLERATTTATGLDAEQDKDNISKTQSKATPNEPSSIGTSLGGGPRRQDTMGDTIAQTRSENVSKFSNDPLLAGVNTPRSDCSSIRDYKSKRRFKKLERKKKSRTHGLKRHHPKNVHDADMFGVDDLDGDEVFVETEDPVVNAATTTSTIPVSAAKDLSDVDMTLAQALAELKSVKPKAITTAATTTTTDFTRPKAKGLVIQDQEQASTLITSSKDKGKGIMVKEPLKMKNKDQVLFDEQEAIRLQAQFDEEERIARENIFSSSLDGLNSASGESFELLESDGSDVNNGSLIYIG
ncbi:putative ribonuclease H-like domain-containing protein [Tanacetum coccineum]